MPSVQTRFPRAVTPATDKSTDHLYRLYPALTQVRNGSAHEAWPARRSQPDHGDQTSTIERIRKIDADTIEDEVTVGDSWG